MAPVADIGISPEGRPYGDEDEDRPYGCALHSTPRPSATWPDPKIGRSMHIDVAAAAHQLEQKGALRRHSSDNADRVIRKVSEQLGQELPADLAALYRENISQVGEFDAIAPIWNDRVGWRHASVETTRLRSAQAVPIFLDGCGSLYGLDLSGRAAAPAVYFFDHEDGFARPRWAAGSSIGAFLLLLGESERAEREKWPPRWELTIDPELEKCPRAPAIWDAE